MIIHLNDHYSVSNLKFKKKGVVRGEVASPEYKKFEPLMVNSAIITVVYRKLSLRDHVHSIYSKENLKNVLALDI